MPSNSEQEGLEQRLSQISDAVNSKINKMGNLRDGLLKDIETAVEGDFKDMRSVMRELEVLAEDQE